MKEQLAKQYIGENDVENYSEVEHNSYNDFMAGWEACKKYLTTFEKGEMVEVTTPDHINSNTWFKRQFVQKDSDGKYGCKDITGKVSRWDFIRKIEG